MNTAVESLRDQKLESLADSYASEGFSVLKQPAQAALPFDLGTYSPDLIASKDGVHLIIEIKTSVSQLSIDRLQSVAEEVAKHPGWRFMVVTLDDVDARAVPTTDDELPGWHQLEAKLEQAEALMQSGFSEPLVLYLRGIVEAASRRRALERHIPVERLRSEVLLKHLYSQGEMSMSQSDALNALWELGDRIAHGGNEAVDDGFAKRSFRTVHELLDEWRPPESNSGASEGAQQAAGQT